MSGRNAKWLIGLLGVLALAVSLAANVWLARGLRARYASQLEQQVWPPGPPTEPRISGDAGPTVLLVGDSRVAEWPAPVSPGVRWVNAGVGGLTAAQLRLRLPALLEAYRPKLVVVEAGINDLKLLGLRPEMAPSLVPETAAHLQAIAELSLARGARVLLLEVWPAAEPDLLRRAVWGPAIAVAVQEVNRSLRTFDAPLRGLHVVDLLSTAQLRPAAESYRDTLHLTAAAYEQITPVLEREIAKALNE